MVQIDEILKKQRSFFQSGTTRELAFRLEQLQKLKEVVLKYEPQIIAALKESLNKSEFESYATEIGFLLKEIRVMMKYLASWSKPKKVKSPVTHFGSKSFIYPEPYGVSLIIAPWNYPFQLTMAPLVGAIAAGNCAVVKPSEMTPGVSQLVAHMIRETFSPDYIAVVEGGVEISDELLEQPFDHIFFTGSVPVGKIIMEKAARSLTPVTLELGGKSPAIVDQDADLNLAAKRIAWGKWTNAGQTCIAPDYLYVHHKIKDPFLMKLRVTVKEFYGEHPLENPDYPCIINQRHFNRLQSFLHEGHVILGGRVDREKNSIEPTVLEGVDWEMPVMNEEIFGPILPVLTFEDLTEVIQKVRDKPKPLSLYYFSRSEIEQERVIRSIPFGGGCVNDTLMHIANPYLPFGGVGSSGFGSYHGKASFDCFSHYKSVLKQTTRFDIPFRYPSFKGGLKIIKKLMK
ncbi:aldehyde dehydrogenase [Kroppenstedtia pulmonis]|uniref:Aldehyde dehydrogenase n=2 Tax=Kroppenstedtia pulmonis TaxID=1380685 RepID=A0A7D3XQ44_9BACL|nr:aldehyde dehydrogenase [Kroppenstedtia pulmonis]